MYKDYSDIQEYKVTKKIDFNFSHRLETVSEDESQVLTQVSSLNTHLGTCMVELIKPGCEAKTSAQKLVFDLSNRLNVPQSLKENCTLKYAFS